MEAKINKTGFWNAVLLGLGLGFYIAFMAAVWNSTNETVSIPHWDYGSDLGPESFKPSASLGLQLQAVLLRFCLLLLNNGFLFLSIPLGLSMLLWHYSHYCFVRCLQKSLLNGAVAYALLFLVLCIYYRVYPQDADSITEVVLTYAYLFNLGLVLSSIWGFVPVIFSVIFVFHYVQAKYDEGLIEEPLRVISEAN